MTWLTWSLLSALFPAATAILAKIGIKGVDANVATAVRTCVVLVFTWLLVYLGQPSTFQSFSKKIWVFLILSGLATGLSWLCYLGCWRCSDNGRRNRNFRGVANRITFWQRL